MKKKICSVFGKLLTNPWMNKSYVSAEYTFNYIDAIVCIKCAEGDSRL